MTEGAREQQSRGIVFRGRRLFLARLAWVAVTLLTVGVFVSVIPSEFARLRTPCTGVLSCVWVPRLSAENAQELRELELSHNFFAVYFVAIEIVFMAVSYTHLTLPTKRIV